MKILKHGWYFYKTNNEHIISCRQCQCEFQYQNDDIHIKNLYDLSKGLKLPCKYVNCPECGYDNFL